MRMLERNGELELECKVSNLDLPSPKSVPADIKHHCGTNFNNRGPRNALKQFPGVPERSSGAFRHTLSK